MRQFIGVWGSDRSVNERRRSDVSHLWQPPFDPRSTVENIYVNSQRTGEFRENRTWPQIYFKHRSDKGIIKNHKFNGIQNINNDYHSRGVCFKLTCHLISTHLSVYTMLLSQRVSCEFPYLMRFWKYWWWQMLLLDYGSQWFALCVVYFRLWPVDPSKSIEHRRHITQWSRWYINWTEHSFIS